MKAFGRALYWLAFNGILLGLAWLGYVEGLDGPRRVFGFAICVVAVLSLTMLGEQARADMQKRGPRVPLQLTAIVEVALALFLAWFGAYFLAVMVLLYLFCLVFGYHVPSTKEPK